jgi:molybdopterin/thiamine biosynthesis adenylyltransferase/rhodanese-related sulfurtransferase
MASGPSLPELTPAQLQRYARHLMLPGVGVEGQRRLTAARVLVIGAGGLGSPVALYLAAAGIGTIGLVDHDAVDVSNLQRQVLHGTANVGRPKVDSGVERLGDLNPEVRVIPFPVQLTSDNALDIIRDFDIVVDGSDNFPTRYLVNDACVLLGKPNVYGSIFQFEGQASLFDARVGPCYRCLFADPPPPGMVPSCAEGGVLGVLPGIVGSIQALEAIKWILQIGESLQGRLLLIDALTLKTRELQLRKDPECPVCGPNPSITTLIDYEAFCGIGAPERGAEVTPLELHTEIATGALPLLLDVREPHEWQIAHLEGARLIPLRELPKRLAELDGHASIVTYCHHGQRSRQAMEFLKSAGFSDVRSLAGGIDAWAREVEPGMPHY